MDKKDISAVKDNQLYKQAKLGVNGDTKNVIKMELF